MPNVKLKNGQLLVDPGGDPAASTPAGNWAPTAGNGGFVESAGVVVSTRNAGWRQLIITRGGAAT